MVTVRRISSCHVDPVNHPASIDVDMSLLLWRLNKLLSRKKFTSSTSQSAMYGEQRYCFILFLFISWFNIKNSTILSVQYNHIMHDYYKYNATMKAFDHFECQNKSTHTLFTSRRVALYDGHKTSKVKVLYLYDYVNMCFQILWVRYQKQTEHAMSNVTWPAWAIND